MQTDATLLANNIQQCWELLALVASVCMGLNVYIYVLLLTQGQRVSGWSTGEAGWYDSISSATQRQLGQKVDENDATADGSITSRFVFPLSGRSFQVCYSKCQLFFVTKVSSCFVWDESTFLTKRLVKISHEFDYLKQNYLLNNPGVNLL